MPRLVVTPSPEAAAGAAAALLADLIDARLAEAPKVHLALAGGTTPRLAYGLLAELVDDWSGVHLWLGDERVVPPEHEEANVRMVREALLRRIEIPAANVHPVPTELGPVGARDAYETALMDLAPRDSATGLPVLDIVLLGLGEDAHVASLFPGAPGLHPSGHACVLVEDAPKPPPTRVSLTMEAVNVAGERVLLTSGPGKAGAVAAALEGPDERVPASLLRQERTTFVLDDAAAASLDEADGRV